MEAMALSAEVRESRGKGPARQLRMRGLIPAIFYGPGVDPVPLQLSPEGIERALTGEYRRNQLIELSITGGSEGPKTVLALVKDLAVEPLSRELRHVDLYAVARDRTVEATVPFLTKGRALGVQRGAAMRKLFRDLPVRAFPQDVPANITLDIAPLDIGANVTVADLVLPPGVEVTFAPNRRVLFIETKERVAQAEEAAPA